MVELPIPTMVTLFPTIVATSVLELVYVIKPLLFEVGGTNVKGAMPNVLSEIVKLIIDVVALLTTRDAVMIPVA
jgi:hypothetical protein